MDADNPRRVVDLGCGAGNLTVQLSRRWPRAVVEALDSSAEMVAAARDRNVDAAVADVRTWTPRTDTDVVLSNAAMQWVPDHRELFVRWVGRLAAGSWLAVQMPGNFESPSHAALRAVAQRPPYAAVLSDNIIRGQDAVDAPARYADLLIGAGCSVDAWETTYVHRLTGEHPVWDWIDGTALRPVRDQLDERDYRRFRDELVPLLAESYPPRPDGTTFYPFRRVFFVARIGG